MRQRTLAILAASAALAGVVTAAPTASAESSPRDCPKGYACILDSFVTVRSKGDWYGSYTFGTGGGHVFNNGYPYPGADHIQVNWTTKDNRLFTKCLHYNPGPGEYSVYLPGLSTVTTMKWRGEC